MQQLLNDVCMSLQFYLEIIFLKDGGYWQLAQRFSDLAKLALKSLSGRMNDERSGDLANVDSILAN